MATNRAKEFGAKALEKLVKYGRRNTKIYQLIADEMTKRANAKFHRQEIAVWLHEDEERRIEPRLGAGLLLIDVGNKVAKKNCKD